LVLNQESTLRKPMVFAVALSFAIAPALTHAEGPTTVAGANRALDLRWVAETPDAMIDAAVVRATSGSVEEGLASIAAIARLETRATFGYARSALATIQTKAPLVAAEAALVARALSPDEGEPAGIAADVALGVVTRLVVVGPFRDTGGGLERKDGPEATGGFSDLKASYAWGTVDVRPRALPEAAVQASGLPLDLFIAPRRESCTLVATKVTLVKDTAFVLSLASSGQVALAFDGVPVAKSEEVLKSGLFERLAVKIAAKKGDHLAVAKICSGAIEDDGRVRLRITDPNGAASADVRTSADLIDAAGGVTAKAAFSAQAVPTPLVRALGAKDHALALAVLRTLGGADDLRSPRAPGLLDKVAQDKSVTADALAMTGWIAPSGANRSGWLDRARTAAIAKGDAVATAFALRRLVAERTQGGMGDWARASWLAGRGSAKDQEAVLLDALTDEAVGGDVPRIAARARLFQAFSQNKDKVPTALLFELTRLSRFDDATVFGEVGAELARRGYGGQDSVLANKTKGRAAVVAAARRAFQVAAIADQDEAVGIVDAVSDAGDHEAAAALAMVLVSFAPNSDAAWSRFADETAAGQAGPASPVVRSALARARSLAPGEARYRALSKMRFEQTDTRSDFHADEKNLAASDVILARRQGVPQGVTQVADRELHWLRAVTLHPDGRISQLLHYAREIVIPPRTESELYEELPMEGDLAEILRARVHRKSGGIATPTEEHNEGTRPRIRWPELFAGDTVEVAIRVWTSTAVGGRGDAPFYFLDYAGAPSTHPLLYNEVVVDTPKDKPFYVDVIHNKPEDGMLVTRGEEAGRVTQRYVWKKPVVVPEEPLSPALSEIAPVIVGSTYKSWADFRKWYADAVKGFTEPDEQVKRMAAELTKGKQTREEKLSALFNFVSDDIRYVNYVSGEWWLPNRPQQLLARREGDCDDKALLLITLLRAVGIEAEEVMVQTRLTAMPSIFQAKNVAVPMFDHGIAFLPGPNGGRYLDATSPESRLGPLPSMDGHAVALRLNGTEDTVELPASRPEDHGSEVKWTIKLTSAGDAELVGEERHTGDGAFYLRTYLTQADARAQYVENNLLGLWFPTVELDKKVDFEPNLAGGAARVRYKARSQGYARREKDELVVALSPSQTLSSQLAPLVKRTLPVELPPYLAPSHQDKTFTLAAPPGYKIGSLPDGGVVDGGDFGRASLTVAADGKGSVSVKRSVVFAAHRIPTDKYPAFRKFVTDVDALMHKTVRFVPEEK
jgi:transglutaminase-like putative cysteine protease